MGKLKMLEVFYDIQKNDQFITAFLPSLMDECHNVIIAYNKPLLQFKNANPETCEDLFVPHFIIHASTEHVGTFYASFYYASETKIKKQFYKQFATIEELRRIIGDYGWKDDADKERKRSEYLNDCLND